MADMDGDGNASGDAVDCKLLVEAALDEAEVEEMEEMAKVAAEEDAGGTGDGGAVFPWHAASRRGSSA